MSNKILYVQKGNKLYNKNKKCNIIGNRRFHSLGGIKQKNLVVVKVVKKSRLKKSHYKIKHNSNNNNNVDEEIPYEIIIPDENYTDLLPLDMLHLLYKYPTAKSCGIIYITNVVLNTLSNDTCTTVTRDLPFYNAFAFALSFSSTITPL
jgi:hypothetical protein